MISAAFRTSANASGDGFSAEFSVISGQAWPRISEGIAIKSQSTPGYPVPLTTYMKYRNASISYTAKWTARNLGPSPIPDVPVGGLFNGALLRLNDPANYIEGTTTPIWPFAIEIWIWNRYDGFKGRKTISCGKVYNDTNSGDSYVIRIGRTVRQGVRIRVFHIINISNPKKSDMHTNTTGLFAHLIKHCQLSRNLDLIETNIFLIGNTGADARFTAEIKSMGGVNPGLLPSAPTKQAPTEPPSPRPSSAPSEKKEDKTANSTEEVPRVSPDPSASNTSAVISPVPKNETQQSAGEGARLNNRRCFNYYRGNSRCLPGASNMQPKGQAGWRR